MRILLGLLALVAAASFNVAAQEIKPIPKTSKEAFAQCEEYNKRLGNTDNCRDDFVYKSMAESEKRNAAEAGARAAAKAQAAKPGVQIGMTQEDVLTKTHWGKPRRINRTTTASSAREQWVYGSGSYLYFTEGKLTAIQN
jgi:hypothetical protein